MDYKFKNVEELQKAFPIDSIFSSKEKEVDHILYCYSEKDIRWYSGIYSTMERIDDVRYRGIKKETFIKRVEGYLFDGEYWMPAYNTWDGWYPYDEDDKYD